MRRTLFTLVVALGFIGAGATRASAQNPFVADGVLVPDAGVPTAQDPQGSAKELGPLNGSPTKIGVINTATPPMLEFTNPNGQVDLDAVYLQTRQATNGDQWLYFGWLRDSANGSGFISIEFQQSTLSPTCVYTTAGIDFVLPESAAETTLINGCNPWRNRQTGDFIILWDQNGNVLDAFNDIKKRTFTCTGSTAPRTCTLGPVQNLGTVEAGISSDRFRGEMAINLTTEVFGTATSCLSFANVLPGTVTGNSDTADYKDTVFATFPPVTNCGVLKVRKVTLDPNGNPFTDTNNPEFGYTVTKSGDALRFNDDAPDHPVDGDPPQISIVRPNDDGGPALLAGAANAHTHTDLRTGTNYTLTEATPLPTPYVLVSIICADGTVGGKDITAGGTFAVKVPSGTFEFTECVITNRFAKTTPALTTTQALEVRLSDSVSITGLTPVPANQRATTVTFRLYSDNACSTQVSSDVPGTLTYNDAGTTAATALTGGIVVPVPGTYFWRVTYPGDSFNNAFTTACGLESTAVQATVIDSGSSQ